MTAFRGHEETLCTNNITVRPLDGDLAFDGGDQLQGGVGMGFVIGGSPAEGKPPLAEKGFTAPSDHRTFSRSASR